MAAKFDLNDDSVVVIVGSGAGGGTLGNELAQKGIKTVMLEAGARNEYEDFVNDEWASFAQLAWKDMRTTSGNWRVHKDFPNLPAWIVKVRRRYVDRTGRARPCASRSTSSRHASTYGAIPGANLLDWPITLADLEPYYAKAEDKMGVTRTNDMPGLPGNNNFKVFKAGADKLGYKECHTGRMAINSVQRDGRNSCQQTGFCFQGCKWGAKWSTLYTEIPKGEATGNLEVRPKSMSPRSSTTPPARSRASSISTKTARCSARRRASSRSPAIRWRARGCCSTRPRRSSPNGLANSSGQVGRNYMRHMTGSVYAVFDKPVHMYRGTTMAGIVRDEARTTIQTRLRRRLRTRDAVARPALHCGVPRSGRLGPRVHLRARRLREHGRHVDRRRGHAAGDQPRHARPPPRTNSACPSPACISTTMPTTSRCATTPVEQGKAIYEAVGATAPSPRRPIPRRIISAPTA